MKEIARLLGVSRSSASIWVRDIELSSEQRARLLWQNPAYNGQCKGSAANREKGRARRLAYQQRGRQLAGQGTVSYLAGCMLWWAEGDRNRNVVRLTNSDPELVRAFARFLRGCFGVDDEEMSIYCNLFADHETRQLGIEQFWLRLLGLPDSSLRKSTINRYSKYSKKKRVNKLPYGTCRIVVYSTEIVQTMYGSIQEFAGFDRPEWLDD